MPFWESLKHCPVIRNTFFPDVQALILVPHWSAIGQLRFSVIIVKCQGSAYSFGFDKFSEKKASSKINEAERRLFSSRLILYPRILDNWDSVESARISGLTRPRSIYCLTGISFDRGLGSALFTYYFRLRTRPVIAIYLVRNYLPRETCCLIARYGEFSLFPRARHSSFKQITIIGGPQVF